LSEIAIAWLRARAARSRKAAANTDLDVELARRGIDKTIGVAIMRTPESNPPLALAWSFASTSLSLRMRRLSSATKACAPFRAAAGGFARA